MLLNSDGLTEEQRLTKAVVKILGEPKYTALAAVLMIGDKVIEDNLPTACTNGRDEKYGRKFVAGLTDAELRGVVLHENYHKLYRHLRTWEHLWKEDAALANMAMDYVINIKIQDANTDGFAVLPEGALVDEKYRDMDTAQVFNLLKDERDLKVGRKGDGEGDDGDGDGDGGDGDSGDGDGRESPTDEGTGFDEHDWEGAQELSDEEAKDLERDIDEAIRQGAMAAGKMGADVPRDIEELLKTKVNWRDVLRDFVQSTCRGNDYSTWARPDRRLIGQDVYMPSRYSERVDELVFAPDTSGSIGQRELTLMLSAVAEILATVKVSKVRVLYWGSSVVGDETYEMNEMAQLVKSTKPRGGGGTDVTCLTEYMAKNGISPQAAIVLTDGYLYGGWGDWKFPVLWTILDNENANPTVGKRVHIKSRDL